MKSNIMKAGLLGFQLQVQSPFIIAFHHTDVFPAGNGRLEPSSYISTRLKGNDFREDVPWRMYHGEKVPGFPYHPHRGFETITVVTKGYVDHADGLHQSGRYGNGDVQWMTAGKGLQHSEMFPVIDTEKENPLELFQIWLNLPKKSKFVEPYFKMLWNEDIPRRIHHDEAGRATQVRIINGSIEQVTYLEANPDSWAYDAKNHVNIWLLELEPEATFSLPAVSKTLNRSLYFYEGDSLTVEDTTVTKKSYFYLNAKTPTQIKNGQKTSYLLLLDGEPINEPVVSYGPFVMNTEQEIEEAYKDYRKTQFGGWPWESDEPVHSPELGRFAKYLGNQIVYPPKNE